MSLQTFFAHPFHGNLLPGTTHRVPAVDVTFVFADVVESTELTLRLGERGAYSVIRRFCSMVRDTALDLGGEPLELRGDGALLGFQAPSAALEFAASLQRACTRAGEVEIRIGVHGGRALRLERGYFGQALILAARLADHAKRGEILVSTQTLDTVEAPREIDADAPRTVMLKGFPEPVPVRRLEWRPAALTRAERPTRQPFLRRVATSAR